MNIFKPLLDNPALVPSVTGVRRRHCDFKTVIGFKKNNKKTLDIS